MKTLKKFDSILKKENRIEIIVGHWERFKIQHSVIGRDTGMPSLESLKKKRWNYQKIPNRF